MKKVLLILLTMVFVITAHAVPREEDEIGSLGTEVGNGGDTISSEFVGIGHKVFEMLKESPLEEVDMDVLWQILLSTTIITKDSLTLRGVEVDAINIPQAETIYVSRSRWLDIQDDSKKLYLVFHEYLWMIGIDDTNYQVSHKLALSGDGGLLNIISGIEQSIYQGNDRWKNEYAAYVKEVVSSSLDFDVLYQIKKLMVNRGYSCRGYDLCEIEGDVTNLSGIYLVYQGNESSYIVEFRGDYSETLICSDQSCRAIE